MRFKLWVLTTAGLLASLACAQQDEPQRPVTAAQDGGVREVMESIVVPPIPNAPFSATLATEWARPTQDGGTITLVNQRQIARDNLGRVYEQRWALVPKGGQVRSIMTWIQIADVICWCISRRAIWRRLILRRRMPFTRRGKRSRSRTSGQRRSTAWRRPAHG